MNRLSTRYAPQMAALAALVLIPVIVHSYADVRSDSCAHPEAIVQTDPGDDPRAPFLHHAFDADQWREGRLPARDDAPELNYSILRSWNPKRLYYRPAYRMFDKAKPVRHEIEWLEFEGERLPIHREHYKATANEFALQRYVAYMLVYDGEAVSNPYLSQIKAAPFQMFSGGQPMTLFFVSATAPGARQEAANKRIHEWLVSQYANYKLVCD